MIRKTFSFFERNKIISAFAILGTTGVINYCSSIPGTSISAGSIYPSIAYHFGIFFILGFFLLAFSAKKEIKIKNILITLIICLVISILDEFHQSFVPFRSMTLNDVLTDLTGSVISVVGFFVLGKIKRKNIK